jgi:dTDP-glucose 4,6-dehydratase
MAHLLVIGGSGFFGKSILDSYQRGLLAPFDITTITVMARSADKLLIDAPYLLNDSVHLLNADISSCNSLPYADIIIHAAASSDERHYISRPQEEKMNIQAGTYNFCKLVPHFCGDAKIVYLSSGAVYGLQPQGIKQVAEDFTLGSIEQLVPQKRDYAAAKRDGEKAILELGEQGFNVSIARCFAFIGPYLPLDQHFAVGNFIRNGLHGEAIVVNTKSLVYRSYLYADDLVQWLIRISQGASPACPILNVGSDEEVLIQDLARQMSEYFQVPLKQPLVDDLLIDRYIPSVAKARSIGCKIEYSLEQAIEKTVTSLLSFERCTKQ